MSSIRCSVFILCGILMSCSSPKQVSPSASAPPASMVGADRDAHDCIASAGYSWCEHTNRCERSWELSSQYNIPNTADGFNQFCSKK
ncbi:MAG: hypothetical protein E6R07_14690 [Nevskiaceae bacterium]|nr:MAG: hypothetical protein E6R07_14690 [Nevskiaceae bacterium]